MAVLFSHITLSADNGSTETFLCGGIPENEDGLENWTAYQNFLEDNPEIESIDVEVKSFLYGDGEIVDANEYEIEYFLRTGNFKDIFEVNEVLYKFDQSLLGV